MKEENLIVGNPEEMDVFESTNNKRVHNKRIPKEKGTKVYCHEPYAEDLYNLYFPDGAENVELTPKDLNDGEAYVCKIDSVNETEAFASTDTGQTVYIEMDKELKDAKKLNITGLDFTPGNRMKLVVRRVNGNYYGSAIDQYVESLKAELFLQIREEKTAYPAKIEAVNKGGYIANISGIRCFLPGSLAAANKITDFESYVGKEIYVMIENYLPQKEMFIVSYKKYLQKIMEQKIQELDLTKK